MNYFLIILDEDEYYCPSSSHYGEKSLSERITKLVTSHCSPFKNTIIIRSDKDNKYWQEKVSELRTNKNKGFLVITIDIANYKNLIGGSLVSGKWKWLDEESKLNGKLKQ